MPLRSYDPTIARWNRIDPVTHFSLSTYNGFDNNPIYYADPSGADARSAHELYHNGAPARLNTRDFHRGRAHDYAASASAGILDNNVRRRGNDIVINWDRIPENGAALWYNAGGQGINMSFSHREFMGLMNIDCCGGEKKKKETWGATVENTSQEFGEEWDNSSLNWALAASAVLFADDATVVGIADDPAIPFLIAGGAIVTLFNNADLIAKQTQEINRILQKKLGGNGMTYALTVNVSGTYIDVRGNPVYLKAGDVWKYGQTGQGFNRYSDNTLRTMIPGGVTMIPQYFGTRTEILVYEKYLIYGHTIMNGSLPPGNRIFR